MEYNIIVVLNAAIMLMGLGILSILLIALTYTGATETRPGRIFRVLLILFLTIFATDIIAWFFDLVPGEPYRTICVVVSFINVIVISPALLAYTAYIDASISPKNDRVDPIIVLSAALTILAIVLAIVSQFNDMYYTIDGNNVFHYNSYYYLMYAIAVLQLLLMLVLVFRLKKHITISTLLILVVSLCLPVFSIVIQAVLEDVMVGYGGFVLSILLIYVTYQTQQNKSLQVELAENRIKILLSQIKPHFLFNSLSTIEGLCIEDPVKARHAVQEFSDYLHANLESLEGKDRVRFDQELEHIKSYLSLEQKRYGNDLQVEYDIQATDFFLPPLTVQPLVENAVRHGLIPKQGGGTLLVATSETKSDWLITIQDDGLGFDSAAPLPESERHIGLANSKERIKTFGGSINISSRPNEGACITICIPKDHVGKEVPA